MVMKNKLPVLTVGRVEIDSGKAKIFEEDSEYYLLANEEDVVRHRIRAGTKVEYVYFSNLYGWFIRRFKKQPASDKLLLIK